MNSGAGGRARSPEACSTWALLLVDAAEGLLSEAEQSVLDRHLAGCAGCALELADAQRGAAWLGLLKGQAPEPPPALLNHILARTTGLTAATSMSGATDAAPLAGASWKPTDWTPTPAALLPHSGWVHAAHPTRSHGFSAIGGQLDRWFGVGGGSAPALQPRLAMTSAMAFFSICLTLNLLGISSHSLRTESLRPAGLQRTVADTGASLVRSFEGIRMVYRVESRVNEWRTASVPEKDAPLDRNR